MANNIPGNPWCSIWTEPRQTIRSIVNANPKFGYFFLTIVYGLPLAFNLVQNFGLAATVPLWALIIGSLILSPFLGMIGISIGAFLLQLVGRLLGGKGSFLNVRAAVAWSNLPNIVGIVMTFILLGIFGAQIFNKNFAEMQFVGYQAGVLFLAFLLESIATIWGFILLLCTLGEVQGFSIWKAILNVVILIVLLMALFWLVSWAFSGTGNIS